MLGCVRLWFSTQTAHKCLICQTPLFQDDRWKSERDVLLGAVTTALSSPETATDTTMDDKNSAFSPESGDDFLPQSDRRKVLILSLNIQQCHSNFGPRWWNHGSPRRSAERSLQARAEAFRDETIVVKNNDYRRHQRTTLAYPSGLPHGRHALRTGRLVRRLQQRFWTALDDGLKLKAPDGKIPVVAHPLAYTILETMSEALSEQLESGDRLDASELERHLHNKIHDTEELDDLRQRSVRGQLPSGMYGFVLDMLESVLIDFAAESPKAGTKGISKNTKLHPRLVLM